METKTRPGLTGNQLKILALIAMTCDHVGLQLLPGWTMLRILGRLAFPIFAYMIAEGCRYTRNRGKYLGRLAAMAALCQIVYYLVSGSVYQCIFVAFTLSVCLIYALDTAQSRRSAASALLAVGALAGVCFVCEGLPLLLSGTDFAVDYGVWGVLLPVMVYCGGTRREKLALLTLGLCLLGLSYGSIQWFGLCAVPLLALYNGCRGKWRIGGLFYLYYPLHLAVIYGISLLLEAVSG
ncbi:MAG: TraX family protein [Firmicutes bacterium]|nr:TraX family protein [Bacillota bacterium]